MEIKYLEWNLHAMGGEGYSIPKFTTQYIKSVDIFVLTEFCSAKGWETFKSEIEKDFDVFVSPYFSKQCNQVCIGLRKEIDYKLLSVVTADVCNIMVPEYLQIDIEIEGRELSIIGTRIKTQNDDSKVFQYNYLKKILRNIDTFICLGDFNCVHRVLSNKFKTVANVYGPRVKDGYHSFVFNKSDDNKRGLDWIIFKGVDVYNGYEDKKQSPNATYDWSFISSENGYRDKTKNDYLGIRGLPDHAILKGMVKIEV